MIYDFSHIFIYLMWFCHGLSKGEIVKTYVIHLLGTYVTILFTCNWVDLGVFNTSRNCVSRSSVEAMQVYPKFKLKSACH